MEWRQVVKWVMVILYSVVVFVAPVTPNVYTGIKCIKNMNTQKLLVRCAVFFFNRILAAQRTYIP
jgi:hypothetical protein